jgi:hypothetical protein
LIVICQAIRLSAIYASNVATASGKLAVDATLANIENPLKLAITKILASKTGGFLTFAQLINICVSPLNQSFKRVNQIGLPNNLGGV